MQIICLDRQPHTFRSFTFVSQTESTTCGLSSFRIIWTRNFKVDTRVAAVAAGLYGIIKPSLWGNNVGKFDRNVLLAALFALGDLDERPSVVEVVRPRISSVFLCFILLPAALSSFFLAVALMLRNKNLKVPGNAWEFMVYGSEQHLSIPKRKDEEGPYPPPDKRIKFHDNRIKFQEDETNERKVILDQVLKSPTTTPDHIFVFQGEGNVDSKNDTQDEIDPWQQWHSYMNDDEDPLPADFHNNDGNGAMEPSGHTATEYTA